MRLLETMAREIRTSGEKEGRRMTDHPLLTTTRVSDKPVLWQAELRASGAAPDGRYGFDLLGTGKTPEAARANARTNLACLKARLFVAEIELGLPK